MATMSRCAVGVALLLASGFACAGTDTVAVRARTFVESMTAYAQVTPLTVTPLRAQTTGELAGVAVLPGDSVTVGALLGHITGPEIRSRIAERQAAVRTALAAVTVARQAVAIERNKFSEQLTTQLAVDKTEASLAQSRAALTSARSDLDGVLRSADLIAPASGVVLSVKAANGERLVPGQVALTLQVPASLLLKATFYGLDAAAVRPDMGGEFLPANGAAPVPVKVRAIAGQTRRDGGRVVWLVRTASTPGWRDGEAGAVTLHGGIRRMMMVPTRALILDQGRWWVLVRRGRNDDAQPVVLGSSIGTETSIVHGLSEGERVVVINAYLRFHRGFAAQYQPPD